MSVQGPSKQTETNRRSRGLVVALFVLLAGVRAMSHAQDSKEPPPRAKVDGDEAVSEKKSEADKQVNVELLLTNPIPYLPEYKYLYQRRRWLAAQPVDTANFEKVAIEFAEKKAFFSAVELLWFADKIATEEERRGAYRRAMNRWISEAGATGRLIDEGEQLVAAERGEEALEKFHEAIKANPYAEKAHYHLANALFRGYLKKAVEKDDLVPLDARTRLYRRIYEEALITIAIDPLFYDAYYLLSGAREIIPDDAQFMIATQPYSERALRFKSDVVPPLEKLENGDRTAETLQKFGEGLESVGVLDYAVFAYQAALAQGGKDPNISERMNALVEKYFTDKP